MEGMDFIHLVVDRDQWLVAVSTVVVVVVVAAVVIIL
jgi:hypothetical protein